MGVSATAFSLIRNGKTNENIDSNVCGVSEEETSEHESEVANDVVRGRIQERTCDVGHVRTNQVHSGTVHVLAGDL